MSSYHFKSKNTDFYIISTNQDADGHAVNTVNGKDSVPKDSILKVTPAISGNITVATITGVNNLFVSLQKNEENAKLTWSKQEFKWIINATVQGTNFITPANGADLFWVDVFGIGPIVVVRSGKNIQPPQNEWIITKA